MSDTDTPAQPELVVCDFGKASDTEPHLRTASCLNPRPAPTETPAGERDDHALRLRPSTRATMEIAHAISQIRAIGFMLSDKDRTRMCAEIEHAEEHLNAAIHYVDLIGAKS